MNHIASMLRNSNAEVQDIFVNEVIEVIQRDRAERLNSLVERREENARRSLEIDDEISDLKKRIEQLDMRRQAQECAPEECDATAPLPLKTGGEFAVGKKVMICGQKHGHEFEIGQVVEIVGYDEDARVLRWVCKNGEERWWISEDEATVLKEEESGFAIGKKVKIHSHKHGHNFEIGQVVEIDGYDETAPYSHWIARSAGGTQWYISEDEATVV